MISFDVTTTDGPMRTSLHTPAGTGPWPAVILVTDAGGPRPAFDAMAQRLADHGFAVAVPDLFHRVGTPFALLPDGGPSRDGRPLFAALRSDPAIRTSRRCATPASGTTSRCGPAPATASRCPTAPSSERNSAPATTPSCSP